MGLHVIFAVTDPTWLSWTLVVLKVVVGVGMVIFVHELGHFLVAKLCGVKCEKFYLGFDFFGLKICKFQWGETEYGIGVFPLGGYVKMLGQEDNPARLREEFERAKAAEAAGTETTDGAAGQPGADAPGPQGPPARGEEPVDLEAVRAALYDPRSYLSKSVPKRMAIISAGVIMNVVFAFVAAAVALGVGVRDVVCGVGEVVPGKAAWQMNIQPGDRILEIAGKKVERFQQLRTGISLGDLAEGVELVLKRPGVDQPIRLTVMPDRSGSYPTIGVGVPFTNKLGEALPVMPGSAAAAAVPAFEPGDRIVKIDGAPVASYADLRRRLALVPDRPVQVTVQRGGDEAAGEDGGESGRAGNQATIVVAPQPVPRLGLVMEMGPVAAVQNDSPAQKAGVLPGDVLQTIDGIAPGDPLTLADRLRGRAGQKVEIGLLRQGKPLKLKDVELRRADAFYDSFAPLSPVAVPSLGVALAVRNKVAAVVPGSPGADAKIAPGSVAAFATVVPPDKETIEREGLRRPAKLLDQEAVGVPLGDDSLNWPFLISRLQSSLPGTTVELTVQDPQGEKRTVTLAPVPSGDGFDPLRGFVFEAEIFPRKAHSLGEAMALGFHETTDSLLLIFRMLRALGSGQVSPKELRGPGGIIEAAAQSAAAGTGEFLMFLCLLSANLAVLNFLPIPVLDGGHMVFLTYEGIRGKPPSERVFVTLSYMGLVFILGLMIWAVGLDVGRWLGGKKV